MHSWRLYSAGPTGKTGRRYIGLTIPLSHIYPIAEQTSPCLNLLMPSARLGHDKYKFGKSSVSDGAAVVRSGTFDVGS